MYEIPQKSRIQDGLVAACGLSAKADRVWVYVAKNLNLAIKLTDGIRIYIPIVGEAVGNTSVLNASSGVVVGALINISTSSESQLESLPGIGPVTAQKIIAGRPYGSLNELLDKKIVGSYGICLNQRQNLSLLMNSKLLLVLLVVFSFRFYLFYSNQY